MNNAKELPVSGSTGEADGAYYNVWLTIPKVAAGVMTNQARAKLSYGGWLEPGEEIVFTITSGSALFAGGLKTTTVTTDSFGCAFAAFTDVGSDAGEMTASMKTNPGVNDTAPYSFSGGASPGFEIALSAIVDNEPADGASDDQGRALVTYGGGALQDRQNVQFVFGAGSSAVFETDKPDVQAGSTGSKLIVKTHLDEQGHDIADAYFHDATGEAVTLIATLIDHPEVSPGTHDFTFAAAPRTYFLGLGSMTPDGVPADGISENLGRAIVSCDGSGLPGPQTVKFTLQWEGSFDLRGADVLPGSDGSTLYVKTHNDGKQDVAYAYFTASNAGTTTLQASLPDHPTVQGRSVNFSFGEPSWPYAIALTSLTLDGVPADGQSENHAQVVVTYGGQPMGLTYVTFELVGAWGAKFDTNKPYIYSSSATTVTVSTHVDEQGRDVADAYFTDTTAERVMLKATFPEYVRQGASPAWRYFFFSASGGEQN